MTDCPDEPQSDNRQQVALPLPTAGDVRAIYEAAVDRYVDACRSRIKPFIDHNYSLLGSLRLHRHAVGLDLLRAPANVALTLPFLASRVAASALDAVGAEQTAERIERLQMFMETDVARELTYRLYADLLQLPFDDGKRRCTNDALAAEILADKRLATLLNELTTTLVRSGKDPTLRSRLERNVGAYMQARTASAELANNMLLAAAGAAVFRQLTPGALSLGPLLATAVAQQAAIATFPLGPAVGGFWYGVVAATPSMALTGAITGVLLGAGAVVAGFAGVLTDPVLRMSGLHRRRLNRFLDSLAVELKGGQQGFVVRDHYVARVFDLIDLAKLAHRAVT